MSGPVSGASPRPRPHATVPWLGATVLLLSWSAAAIDFERIALETPLTPGVGLEGALTIYDETPRMFRSLGQPTRSGGGKYVYEGTRATIVIEASYEQGRFPIRSLTVLGRDPRLHTPEGAAAGDEPTRVASLYGPPAEESDTRLRYPALGLELMLGPGEANPENPAAGAPRRVVTGFVIRRAELDEAPSEVPGEVPSEPPGTPAVEPAAPGEPTPSPAVVPAVVPAESGVSFHVAGLALSLGPRWRTERLVDRAGGVARAREGGGTVSVERCERCEKAVEDKVKALEAQLGPNRLPAARQTLDDDFRKAVGADSGYAAVYGAVGGTTPTWVLALRRGVVTWLVVISLTSLEPSPDLTADVLGALRGLALVP